MPLQGDFAPSPWDFVADQVRLYEATGGKEGGTMNDQPCVILWTRGRRSGLIRKSPLIRVEHDGSYAVVASLGGAPKHPVWYLNLTEDPAVTLQDGADVYDFQAREVFGDEKAAWWARAVGAWPSYDEYQASTDRVIPLVVLAPA